jgi:uncharacterized membrane protein
MGPSTSCARGAVATLAALLLAMGLAALLATPAGAQSRAYNIADVRIDAELRPDGSLAVIEDRTFRYRGTFFGAFYTLKLRGAQQVSSFALSDSTGLSYSPGRCSQDGERQPGAYAIETSRREFKVTWCYGQPATDEQRTYRLSYVISGAATRHEDTAELYWQWIGTGWDVSTDRVVADVRLPNGQSLAAGEDLLIWGHGPLTGTVNLVEPGVVRTQAEGIPPATFVELRALFPPELLAAAPSDGRTVRDGIVAEETCFAVAANAERARARGEVPTEDCDPYAARHRLANIGVLVGLVGGGALWGRIFVKHGREYPLPPGLTDYERDVPDAVPPALVDYLMNWGSIDDKALVATIMDLIRQGHITIHREHVERRRRLRSSKLEEVLVLRGATVPEHAFERDVMHLLFVKAGDGYQVTDADLKAWVSGDQDSAYSWWQSWKKAIEREAKQHHWIESTGWVASAVGLGVVVAGAGIALAVGLGAAWPLAALAVVGGIVMVGASPVMKRRTVHGRTMHHRWERLASWLKEYSLVPEHGPEHLTLWGKLLVYAIPLGVADEVMRNLDAKLSAAEIEQLSGGYYPLVYAGDGHRPSLTSGMAALSAAIPSGSISTSPSSSGDGGGGGFSGGGGGGGGGSGGGAF